MNIDFFGLSRRQLFILLAVPLLLYSFSLPGEFAYDDIAVTVVQNPALTGEAPISEVITWDRPLREFTYMLDHAVWDLNPIGYHLQNILWHSANTLLLCAFLCLLGIPTTAAFIVALLFAVHTLNTESVAWISGRKELLCFFFEVLTCHLFIYSTLHKSVQQNKWIYALSLLSLLLALLSKQVAIMTPFLMLLSVWFYGRNRNIPIHWRKIAVYALPHIGLMLLFLFGRFDVVEELDIVQERGTFYDPGSRDVTYTLLSAALTPFATLAKTFEILLWPINLTVEHAFQPVESLTDVRWIAGFLITITLTSIAWRERNREPSYLFGLVWFALAFAPVSGAIPVAYLFAERYLYIPAIGLILFGVQGALAFFGQSHKAAPMMVWARTLLIALVLLLSLRTGLRIYDWQSEIRLWESAIRIRPSYAILHYNLGNSYARKQNIDNALRHWQMALYLNPDMPQVWLNKGNLMDEQGNTAEAEAAYRKALEIYPDYGAAHFNLALLLEKKGDTAGALDHLNQAVKTLYFKQNTPRRVGLAHYHLARLLHSQGKTEQAEAHLIRAEQMAPNLPQVYNLKGLIFQNDLAAARQAYQTAVDLSPEYAEALYNWGVLEWQKGDPEKALQYWEQAATLKPELKKMIDRVKN